MHCLLHPLAARNQKTFNSLYFYVDFGQVDTSDSDLSILMRIILHFGKIVKQLILDAISLL